MIKIVYEKKNKKGEYEKHSKTFNEEIKANVFNAELIADDNIKNITRDNDFKIPAPPVNLKHKGMVKKVKDSNLDNEVKNVLLYLLKADNE